MNYYSHHIGDYAAATAHLTWDEDMAYTRLLRAYYHHEAGIKEGQQYRLARATTPAQVKAVDVVIGEFFTLDGALFIQKRADKEIAKMREKLGVSEVRDAHEAERMRRHRDRRAEMFADLRASGIVPPWDVPIKELQRLCDENKQRTCNAPVTHLQREHVGACNAPATAIPIANNQEPITKQPPPPPGAEAPGGAFAEFWALWPVHPRKVARQQCQQKWAKKGLDAAAEAVLSGLRACIASEAWSKAGGEFVPAPLVWLNQARWEAPSEAQAVQAVNAEHWHESRQGIEGKGADLGLGRWDEAKFSTGQGEQWPAYRARVFRAAGYHTLRSANG